MRPRLVAGNWKMNGSLPVNEALLKAVANASDRLNQAACVVCVPFPYLPQAQRALTGSSASWGAQNVSQYAKGAYTGEVSAAMLREFGCRYVIVGHSERRAIFGEDDAVVASKVKAALEAELTPIFCVGESLSERDSGVTETVVGRQLRAALDKVGAIGIGRSVVAYEPVWAIGTGKTATPEQAQAVHAFIRAQVAKIDEKVAQDLAILYGGSVKAANARALFNMQDIDGGLIGGASLDAAEFDSICLAADR